LGVGTTKKNILVGFGAIWLDLVRFGAMNLDGGIESKDEG
jgi:hypothetical protein